MAELLLMLIFIELSNVRLPSGPSCWPLRRAQSLNLLSRKALVCTTPPVHHSFAISPRLLKPGSDSLKPCIAVSCRV